MPDTLLLTKLFIPPPCQDLIPRSRLTDRLEAGLPGKLTLAWAPGRYGKSTLEPGTDPPVENLLTALVNDITALATRFVLVLDDCHII